MPGEPPDRTPSLESMVRAAMDAAWVEAPGYTAPNTEVYPWMWLWDSCFHSIVWLGLGDAGRAVRELESALSTVDEAGFVAHMGYQLDPERPVELWGRRGASSITQPPMYGHTIRVLADAGVAVADATVDAATRGLRFLLDERVSVDGLVGVVHPWETGCDDSPRWDDLCPGDGFDVDRWRAHKVDLLASIERGPHGEPLANPAFRVGSAGFTALTIWNAQELAAVTGDEGLAAAAADRVGALDARFDDPLGVWIDTGAAAEGSGRARTADSVLPLLVTASDVAAHRAMEGLLDEDEFASAYGPRGVHGREPTYDAATYWRGPVWPQLAYLLWIALDGRGEADAAEVVRTTTIAGATESGLAEYWDGESGRGLGAIPQSWTGLALVLAEAEAGSSA